MENSLALDKRQLMRNVILDEWSAIDENVLIYFKQPFSGCLKLNRDVSDFQSSIEVPFHQKIFSTYFLFVFSA